MVGNIDRCGPRERRKAANEGNARAAQPKRREDVAVDWLIALGVGTNDVPPDHVTRLKRLDLVEVVNGVVRLTELREASRGHRPAGKMDRRQGAGADRNWTPLRLYAVTLPTW